jgi:hypothetical protein
MDGPPGAGRSPRLHPVSGLQLLHDVPKVHLNRLLGNQLLFGGVSIPGPADDVPQHVELTRRQVFLA